MYILVQAKRLGVSPLHLPLHFNVAAEKLDICTICYTQVKHDPRSYERNFSNCVEEKPEKFKTSTIIDSLITGTLEPINDTASNVSGFIAQLVRSSHRIYGFKSCISCIISLPVICYTKSHSLSKLIKTRSPEPGAYNSNTWSTQLHFHRSSHF